jgi:hypothetical protein
MEFLNDILYSKLSESACGDAMNRPCFSVSPPIDLLKSGVSLDELSATKGLLRVSYYESSFLS